MFGDANCIVKWVDNTEKYTDNNSSIVLQLNYKNKKYLFTGDMETEVEDELIKNEKLEEIDILKVSHHGSNSSTSNKFLDKINPKIAIISSGSTYSKFPHIECLKRLLKKIEKSNLYITERDGTIWITGDGISNDEIRKLDKINLDGANSNIDSKSLNNEYLESLLIGRLSFL